MPFFKGPLIYASREINQRALFLKANEKHLASKLITYLACFAHQNASST